MELPEFIVPPEVNALSERMAAADVARQAQLDRIETKLDEVLAFRDLIMETAAPFLRGGKSSVWLAMLAKSKGRGT